MDVGEILVDLLRVVEFVDITVETRRLPLGKQWGKVGFLGTLSTGVAIGNFSGSVVTTVLFFQGRFGIFCRQASAGMGLSKKTSTFAKS